MPADFPASPSVNDVYTFSGKSWIWTGVAWNAINPNAIGPTGPTGPQGPPDPTMVAIGAQFFA